MASSPYYRICCTKRSQSLAIAVRFNLAIRLYHP